MTDIEFTATRSVSWSIPMEGDPDKGWTIVITRTDSDKEGQQLSFALHWGGKKHPTHEVVGQLSEFSDMLKELIE